MNTLTPSRSLLNLALAAASTLAGLAHADDPGVTIYNAGPAAAAAVNSYWTSDRVANAKPMPFGVVKGDANVEGPQTSRYGDSILDFTSAIVTGSAKSSPFKATGKLFFTKPGIGDFQCSASVIRHRIVVTAAHCMYSSDIGFHSNWLFIPAYNGTSSDPAVQRPLGSWSWAYGIVPSNWLSTGGALPNATDFGLLEMVDQTINGTATRIGSRTGRYTTAVGHLADTHVTMLGYPCNISPSGTCGELSRADSSDHRTSSDGNAFEYGSDFGGGASGGPWIENFGASTTSTGGYRTPNAVVGVSSYIYGGSNQLILGASQFNADFTSILNSACNNRPGNC